MLPRSLSLPLRNFLFIILLATHATAGPVYERSRVQQQQILKSDGLIMPSKQQRLHTSQFLDASPNSIGILLTTAGGEEEEVLHLWLPIGERVYTRTSLFSDQPRLFLPSPLALICWYQTTTQSSPSTR